MRKDDVVALLLKAAEVSARTEFVIIGSQAIHGTIPDPDLDVVTRSTDVDLYPVGGYGERFMVFQDLMLHLGQDSDYHIETDVYLEAVQPDLARFPAGWEARVTRECIGSVEIAGVRKEVTVVFPEIHDLTVSKLAVGVEFGRDKDIEFLDGVVRLGLVKREILHDRYPHAPRLTKERMARGLTEIDEACARRSRAGGASEP
jgi:hypothetical protein